MPKRVSELNSTYPIDCDYVRRVRLQYASWIWLPSDRYIRYYNGGWERKYEHRLVAELAYGNIPDGYHVHHRNGDCLNNAAYNLQVLSPQKHGHLHKGTRTERLLICDQCGKPFFSLDNIRYCSRSCNNKANTSKIKPDADSLSELLATVGNWSAIGRMFGVSDNAVRKWAKSYHLDISICDGRVHRTSDNVGITQCTDVYWE